jgi:predicted amidohydrolase
MGNNKYTTLLIILLFIGGIAQSQIKKEGKFIKIGHWQLQTNPGNFEENLTKLIDALREADKQGIQIVSFPEAFLTGYFKDAEKARKNNFSVNSPEIKELLDKTKDIKATFMVGFNESRGDKLYNTVLVAEQGKLMGTYSKAFPCYGYFSPGRDFPVFERDSVKFGVIICADGGFIEPARILALKGASIIFAPHYNYIKPEMLINHFKLVRSDHIARAVENSVWFVRGNSVTIGYDKGMNYKGIGYGDSYIIDPRGEMVVKSERNVETLISSEINIDFKLLPGAKTRSEISAKDLGEILLQTIERSK